MKNLDLYIKIFEIIFMFLLELKIVMFFHREVKANIAEFNKINNHKSIRKERAIKFEKVSVNSRYK